MEANKNIILIKDNLEEYQNLLEQLSLSNFFTVTLATYEEFCHPEFSARLEKNNPDEILIIVEQKFRELKLETITAILEKHFLNYQPLLLTFKKETPEQKEEQLLEECEHCFLITPGVETGYLVYYFNNFCRQIFLESSYRYHLYDYMSASVNEIIKSDNLTQLYKRIKDLNVELEKKNLTDALTELYNRRALYQFLNSEMNRTKRRMESVANKGSQVILNQKEERTPEDYARNMTEAIQKDICALSVLMIDIDYFKKINDTYGHLTGDRVLTAVGKILKRRDILRTSDIPSRYGGEEFLIILPETSSKNAVVVAERIQQAVSKEIFYDEDKNFFKITLSIGISQLSQTDRAEESLINRADKALYQAKESGRNRIVTNDEPL